MAEENTAVAEPAETAADPTLGDAFGAMLDRTFGALPGQEPPPADAPPPAEPPAEPPVKPAEPKEEPKPPAEPPPPADDLTPPPSVLGKEEPPAEPELDQVDKEFGVIPEKPGRGFKNKEEEVNWSQIRDSHEKLKNELRAVRQKATEAPPVDEGMKAQLADALKRNEQLNAIVEQVATERLPWVEEKFNQPRARLVKSIRTTLENVDVEPDSIDRVLASSGKQRVKLTDQLYEAIDSSSAKAKIAAAIEQIEQLDEGKAEFLADRKGNVERMTQEQKAEQFRQFAEQEKKMNEAIDATVVALAKNGMEFLVKTGKQGYEKWDRRIDSRVEAARNVLLRNKDPLVLIDAVMRGQLAGDYQAAFKRTLERAEKAEAKIKELEGTLPSMERRREGGGAPNGAADEIDSSMDFGRAAVATLHKVARGE